MPIIPIPRNRVFKEMAEELSTLPPDWFLKNQANFSAQRPKIEVEEESFVEPKKNSAEVKIDTNAPVSNGSTRGNDQSSSNLQRLGNKNLIEILRLAKIKDLVALCKLTEEELRNRIRPFATSYSGKIPSDNSYIKVVFITRRLKTLGLELQK